MNYELNKYIERNKLNEKYPLIFSPKLYHFNEHNPKKIVHEIYFGNQEINDAI